MVKRFFKFVTIMAGILILLFGLWLLDTESGLKKPITIKAGSYSGQVFDAATGEPIEGAAVYMAWRTTRRFNSLESMLFQSALNYIKLLEELVYTDETGRYQLPVEECRQWEHWRTSKPHVEVFIYKKGYVAFNNEWRFDGYETHMIENPGEQFKAKQNTVRLKPWEEGFSHHSHYHFMNDSTWKADNKFQKKLSSLIIWEADRKFRENY